MRERFFIDQNKTKWSDFEQSLQGKHKNPEIISRLFVQITDDLSFSRTFYKNRSVRLYLNAVAQFLFQDIYKTQKKNMGDFVHFWKVKLPLLVFQARKEFFISFSIFAISFLIGVFTSMQNPQFANQILGDSYIEMTVQNIKQGEPMAVYKQPEKLNMFLGITLNNLLVSFRTFIFGVFMSIGTVVIMVYNGIMVGTFQYFFVEQGIFKESFLTIWQHGTLEISAIIIAGAAGLTLGKGLVFPGTFTRSQSLRMSARRGLKIMVGITPVIMLAAFIEGFITRQTQLPDAARLLTILFSLAFVLAYFVWLPWRQSKKYPELASYAETLKMKKSSNLGFETIKSSDDIFGNTFFVFQKKIGKFLGLAALVSVLYALLSSVLNISLPLTTHYLELSLKRIDLYFSYENNSILFFMNSILFSLIALFAFHTVRSYQDKLNKTSFVETLKSQALNAFILFFSLNASFFIESYWKYAVALFVLPVMFTTLYYAVSQERSAFTALSQIFKILHLSWGTLWGIYIRFLVLATLTIILITSRFMWFFIDFVNWNLHVEGDLINYIHNFISTFIILFTLSLILLIIASAYAILNFTLHEKTHAAHLMERIKNIGDKSKSFGFEKESPE